MGRGPTRTLAFNGWAAGPEAWALTRFRRDWTFSYVEQLDGLPARVIAGFDRVVLVGFSMGGSSALETLLDFPDKVAGIVLVSAAVRMMEERLEPTAEFPRGEVVWKGMSERRLAALRLGTRMVFARDPSPIYADANLDRGLEFLRRVDLRRRLEDFSADPRAAALKVAVVASERDGIVARGNAEFLKRIFPQASLTWVPGMEHVLPITASHVVDAAVRSVRSGLRPK